jgi:hypothetical protein
MREASSFIVRIYGKADGARVTGSIEVVHSGERIAFGTRDELWSIVVDAIAKRRRARRTRSASTPKVAPRS